MLKRSVLLSVALAGFLFFAGTKPAEAQYSYGVAVVPAYPAAPAYYAPPYACGPYANPYCYPAYSYGYGYPSVSFGFGYYGYPGYVVALAVDVAAADTGKLILHFQADLSA
jgi:hypothetical protein